MKEKLCKMERKIINIFPMNTVLYVAQFMGFLPIQGIRTADPFKFKFCWRTIRVLITMIYFALGISIATMYLQRIAGIGINAKNMGETFLLYM